VNSYDPIEHVYRSKSGRLPGATDVIKTEGLINPDWLTEYARWRGKCVHRGVELLNKNELDWETVDVEIKGYLRSYERFLTVTKFQVVGAEEDCFSQAFACLPDIWGVLNGHKTIVELKSGPVPEWAAFQTALQRRALAEDKDFLATKRFGLQLMADGSLSKLRPFEDWNDERRAMGMVEMFHWKKDHGYFKWEATHGE